MKNRTSLRARATPEMLPEVDSSSWSGANFENPAKLESGPRTRPRLGYGGRVSDKSGLTTGKWKITTKRRIGPSTESQQPPWRTGPRHLPTNPNRLCSDFGRGDPEWTLPSSVDDSATFHRHQRLHPRSSEILQDGNEPAEVPGREAASRQHPTRSRAGWKTTLSPYRVLLCATMLAVLMQPSLGKDQDLIGQQ